MASRWQMPMLALGLTLAAAGLVLALYLGRTPWAAVPSVAGGAMLLTAVLGLWRSHRDARVRPEEARPVPAPSAATLAELPEPVTSCPRCGSLEILPLILAQQGNEVACPRCDYLGEPIHFLRRHEYGDYVRGLVKRR